MSAEATVTMGDTSAKLSITKSAAPEEDAEVGTEITYTVVVKNEGDVKVTPRCTTVRTRRSTAP